ncbi:MAG TPA: GntR family transcriptional regulator [Gemmatimonadales bacterium]|nr:GntR family transcriptional regulator [Gemmatimonadales bacterium]
MPSALDSRSPVPLYHQLAEVIRYQIATGGLPAGTPLPPLRTAAANWKVNLHTVRHAYAVLARQGLVHTHAPFGTVVAGGRGLAFDEVDRFVHRVLRDAARLGITIDLLRDRLGRAGARPLAQAREDLWVVECSSTQSADLARQIEEVWDVRARPWTLEQPGEPAAGLVVGTYFHYNDIRTRWPARFPTVRFVAIRPDPGLPDRLRPFTRHGRRTVVRVCEREAGMAANIAADLAGILPASRFDVLPVVETSPGATLENVRFRGPVLFAPRVWGKLTSEQRADSRAVEVRYVVDPRDLTELGVERRWQSRAA